MDAGFSSLAVLKARLLAEVTVDATTWDAAIAQIGKGVAAQFNRYCNREFKRATGTEVFNASKMTHMLRRYPVEAITKLELKDVGDADFLELVDEDEIEAWGAETGIVYFAGQMGTDRGQGRITYTGGYWWDEDEEGAGTMPEGATALPGDIQDAWFFQCEAIWAARDRLGVQLTQEPKKASAIGELKMSPIVEEILKRHVRQNLI